VRTIEVSAPEITASDRGAVMAVLRRERLAMGPATAAFERACARAAGVGRAVAVSSGTAGLHALIQAFGIGHGDEVVTTPYSFVASSNCVLFEHATVRFADIDPITWNLDPAAAEAAMTRRTRALLPVHVFGLPYDHARISRIARPRGIPVIEDACEALGASWHGKAAGSLGDAAVFAFYPNKQITTGEGGMILTRHAKVEAFCRSVINQGRGDGGFLQHVRLGANYRLDEMSAALGVSQMSRLPAILKRRAAVAARYGRLLSGIPGVEIPVEVPGLTRSWFVYVIRLAEGISRDGVSARMARQGVQTRPYFPPIHLQPFYRERFGYMPGTFPVAEAVGRSTLALPFHTRLSPSGTERVVNVLRKALSRKG
jgi:perosamine synthetase